MQFLIQLVHKDTETTIGKNIRYILKKTGGSNIFKNDAKKMKKEYKFFPLHPEDVWKVFFIKELTHINPLCLYLENERVEAGQKQN